MCCQRGAPAQLRVDCRSDRHQCNCRVWKRRGRLPALPLRLRLSGAAARCGSLTPAIPLGVQGTRKDYNRNTTLLLRQRMPRSWRPHGAGATSQPNLGGARTKGGRVASLADGWHSWRQAHQPQAREEHPLHAAAEPVTLVSPTRQSGGAWPATLGPCRPRLKEWRAQVCLEAPDETESGAPRNNPPSLTRGWRSGDSCCWNSCGPEQGRWVHALAVVQSNRRYEPLHARDGRAEVQISCSCIL